jgi:hypothetical protein
MMYQLVITVDTDDAMTEEFSTSIKGMEPKIHEQSLVLASMLLSIPQDKLFFQSIVLGEIKFDEANDEEVPVSPVVD